ncbi:alcohol dehydrogenase catalytic domain-containing protein [Planctomycetota bacterium]
MDDSRAWHLTGTGYDALRLADIPVPSPGPREILLRQECVTICFSAIKEIKLGAEHPRLAGRDLASDPVILGDESVGTVMEVGSELGDRFHPGEVYVIQPDLGDGRAFGYGIPGGLARYRLVPEEFFGQLLSVNEEAVRRLGFFSFPLAEPLGCVEKSCSIAFRPAPRRGGRMLLVSSFSASKVTWGFEGDEGIPEHAVIVDPGEAFRGVVKILASHGVDICSSDAAHEGDLFDDIIIAAGDDRELPELFENTKDFLDRNGTLSVIGNSNGSLKLPVDVGAVHYQGHIILGSSGCDISSCYRVRPSYSPRKGDTVLLLGAGGPMGQMFVLWMLGNEETRPARVICSDVDDKRLDALHKLGSSSPERLEFRVVDARKSTTAEFLSGVEVDYLVILCPVLDAVKECVPFLAEGAVLNCFAGMKGAVLPLGVDAITSRRLRIVGFSGLDTPAMKSALSRIVGGDVDVSPVVAAVGGMDAGRDALEACGGGTYPGKIVIYNGIDAPLRPCADLTGGDGWSGEFERRFLAGELG